MDTNKTPTAIEDLESNIALIKSFVNKLQNTSVLSELELLAKELKESPWKNDLVLKNKNTWASWKEENIKTLIFLLHPLEAQLKKAKKERSNVLALELGELKDLNINIKEPVIEADISDDLLHESLENTFDDLLLNIKDPEDFDLELEIPEINTPKNNTLVFTVLDDVVPETVTTTVQETPVEEVVVPESVTTIVQETPVEEVVVPESVTTTVQEAPVEEVVVPESVTTTVQEAPVEEVVVPESVTTTVQETPVEEVVVPEVVTTPVQETPVEEVVVPEVVTTTVQEAPVEEVVVPESVTTTVQEAPVEEVVVPEVVTTPVQEAFFVATFSNKDSHVDSHLTETLNKDTSCVFFKNGSLLTFNTSVKYTLNNTILEIEAGEEKYYILIDNILMFK